MTTRASQRERPTPDLWATPPTIAKEMGVAPETAISWIKSGELKAVDVSARPGHTRPRYRINRADLAEFLAGRQVFTPPATKRRRRKPAEVEE